MKTFLAHWLNWSPSSKILSIRVDRQASTPTQKGKGNGLGGIYVSVWAESTKKARSYSICLFSCGGGGGSSPSDIAQSFELLLLVLILNEHVPFLNSGLISKVPYVSKSGKEIWVVANKDWQTNAYTTQD